MLYNHDYATDSKHHERKGDDMPPKAKFTKDEMINVALAITRRSGIETGDGEENGYRAWSFDTSDFHIFQID